MPKMQPLSGNQQPDFLTALMNMSLVLHLPRKMYLCRSSSNAPRLPSFLEMPQNPHVLLTFDKVHNPLRLPRETTSERPKLVWACRAFHILTLKCTSRHNGMHFFDISTSIRSWCALCILTSKCASRTLKSMFLTWDAEAGCAQKLCTQDRFRWYRATSSWNLCDGHLAMSWVLQSCLLQNWPGMLHPRHVNFHDPYSYPILGLFTTTQPDGFRCLTQLCRC